MIAMAALEMGLSDSFMGSVGSSADLAGGVASAALGGGIVIENDCVEGGETNGAAEAVAMAACVGTRVWRGRGTAGACLS